VPLGVDAGATMSGVAAQRVCPGVPDPGCGAAARRCSRRRRSREGAQREGWDWRERRLGARAARGDLHQQHLDLSLQQRVLILQRPRVPLKKAADPALQSAPTHSRAAALPVALACARRSSTGTLAGRAPCPQ